MTPFFRGAVGAAAALIAFAAAPAAHAVNIITWGGLSTDKVTAINNGAGSTTIFGANVPISIDSLNGAPVNISAYLNLSTTSTDAATLSGPSILQHYSGVFFITAGSGGNGLTGGTGTNYLSATFSDAVFGSGSALTLSSSEPSETVSFTSGPGGVTDLDSPRAFAIGLTNVTPSLSIDNGSINSFTASQSGTVSAEVGVLVPEPASFALLGIGTASLGMLGRRRKH